MSVVPMFPMTGRFICKGKGFLDVQVITEKNGIVPLLYKLEQQHEMVFVALVRVKTYKNKTKKYTKKYWSTLIKLLRKRGL